MIIQENDFLKTYNELVPLWEDASAGNTDNLIMIKGKPQKFLTPFMPVEKLSKEDFSRPGIYIWKRLPYEDKDPAYYVGKSVNLYKRTEQHTKAGKRDSRALHLAIKEHGLEAFLIAIIEVCALDELSDREKHWIKKLGTFRNKYDYNLTPGGDGGSGPTKVTPEMFKHIVTQLRETNLPFAAIARQEEVQLDATTVGDINANRFSYEEEFAKMLNLTVTFPIRSEETTQEIKAEVLAQNSKAQAELWQLTLVQSDWKDESKTTIVKVSTENLGKYLGRWEAWDKICEVEHQRFNTPADQLQTIQNTLLKGTGPAAYFEPLILEPNKRRYKRKYIIERLYMDLN
jgi:group I intron endonuclease